LQVLGRYAKIILESEVITMILGKKVRLILTEIQEQKLWQSVGTARFIYNWTLAKQEENYKNGGKFIPDNELRKEITQLKKTELQWLNEVSNNVAKQAVKDACLAYKKFFKKLADKPKFKSRRKSKPSFYNDNIKLKVKNNAVLIEKIGWVNIKRNEISINCKYSNPRISFDGKYWLISVGIEKEQPIVELTNESIGIDVGIKDLAICSNGMTFKNINKTKNVKKFEKRLRRLQRRVSRKYLKNKEGNKFVKTSNIIKIEKQIKLLHRKLSNIRRIIVTKQRI
jgi:putative transposase